MLHSAYLRLFSWILIALLLVFTGCNNDDDPQPSHNDGYRGQIVSYQKDTSISKDFFKGLLPLIGVDTNAVPINADVDIYSVVYQTPNYDGTQTTASGQIALPQQIDGPIRLASYQHGTIVRNIDAPSSLKEHIDLTGNLASVYVEQLLPAAFASTGYAVCAPDYLALGDGPGDIHPYMHAETEASSTIDMMRATRTVLAELNVQEKSDGVVLFGYSQGGHATSASQREMEANLSSEFPIFCSVPMSGPYDLSGAQVDLMLMDEPYPQPFYLPYVLFSYDMIYDMYGGDQSAYLKPEFVDTLYNLLVGRADPATLNAAMPGEEGMKRPKDILLDSQIADFTNNSEHPLRVALDENDLKRFTPQAPTHIIYCDGDDEVPGQHSVNAYNAWTANGAPALTIFNGGTLTHAECVPVAMTEALEYVQALEQQ
ncbi:MAG: lipase family protein [Bacteroidota bacterium]